MAVFDLTFVVSTHSRLKAAGSLPFVAVPVPFCFNTQPPEGGWTKKGAKAMSLNSVSTHSRLKAAGH